MTEKLQELLNDLDEDSRMFILGLLSVDEEEREFTMDMLEGVLNQIGGQSIHSASKIVIAYICYRQMFEVITDAHEISLSREEFEEIADGIIDIDFEVENEVIE